MVTLLTTGDPDESAQSAARQLMGRYTLEEAVQALAKNVEDIDVKVMLKDLKAKVLDGTVKAYAPAQVDISHTPVTVRSYYEEVEWDVLNKKWLTHFDAIGWRYPDPLDKLRPDWSYWNLDHLPLEDAISLSIDVTPEWTLFTKELGRKNILRINCDHVPRLKNALNWAQSLDCPWRYNNNHLEFKQKSLVKLNKFSEWVINEKLDWKIPIQFQALSAPNHSMLDISTESSEPWTHNKWVDEAKIRATRLNITGPSLSIDAVTKKIADEFLAEGIVSSHGGKPINFKTIRRQLSNDQWFSKNFPK